MDPDTDLIPSSQTNSSPSSSDLDTESTGSFFPDRSTTLGTLMGVNFQPNQVNVRTVRVPSRRESSVGGAAVKKTAAAAAAAERRRRRKKRKDGRRSWWRLCRDDMVGPTTLRVEAGEGEEGEEEQLFGEGGARAEHVAMGGGPLFENGRVLPPRPAAEGVVAERRRRRERIPVMLAGICSGGEG